MDDRRYERKPASPSQKIYISNLNMDTTQGDLRKSFEPFGAIVDINLKQKDTGIVFAFIQYDSTQSAEKAIDAMNRTTFLNKELKVQFARGRERNDRGGDRGGFRDRGDRGDRGFRGRSDYNDRDRRNNDRPKGCFNCGQQGHFAKDCSKPRKPRQFNNDRNDREGYRGGGNRDYRGGNDRRGGGRDRDRDHDRKRDNSRSDSSRSRDRKRKQKKRSPSSSSGSH